MESTSLIKAPAHADHDALGKLQQILHQKLTIALDCTVLFNPSAFSADVGQPNEALVQQYNEWRLTWNQDLDAHPMAIICAQSIAHVRAAVLCAKELGVSLAVSAGRHSITCMVTDQIVVDLRLMATVTVDPEARTVVTGPGVKNAQFDRTTTAHNLATPAGHNADTGVAGLTLAGGVGYLSRPYGLTVDNLLEVQVVLADGSVVRANKDENTDLFWALRGGGGNFGIAVEFKFQLHPMPENIRVGNVAWQITPQAQDMMKAWRDIAVNASDMYNSHFGYVCEPAAHMKGVMAMVVQFDDNSAEQNEFGEGSDSHATISALKAIAGDPVMEMVGPSTYVKLQTSTESMQPSRCYYERGALLKELSDECIKTIHEYALKGMELGPTVSTFVLILLMGGEIGRVPPSEMAFFHRNCNYWVMCMTAWNKDDPDAVNIRERASKWSHSVRDALQPFSTGSYAAIIGTMYQDATHSVYGTNFARLREIKAQYDPTNMFRWNRNILPADP